MQSVAIKFSKISINECRRDKTVLNIVKMREVCIYPLHLKSLP